MKLYLSSFRIGNHTDELIKLMAGKKRVAVIANALDYELDNNIREEKLQREISALKNLGLRPVELDLRQYFGQQRALEQKMKEYDAVWVRGGNVFILRRAFAYSGFDGIATKLIQQDNFVYGGYSAGVCILEPSFRGTELVDEPNTVPTGYKDEIIWDGLNVLGYAVAPHYKSDHPESKAINNVVDYYIDNHIPFIALRDGEVIVVDGEQQNVLE